MSQCNCLSSQLSFKAKMGMIGRRRPEKIEIFIVNAYFGESKISTFRGDFLESQKYNFAHTSDSDRARRVLPESAQQYELSIVEPGGGVRICTVCDELSQNLQKSALAIVVQFNQNSKPRTLQILDCYNESFNNSQNQFSLEKQLYLCYYP